MLECYLVYVDGFGRRLSVFVQHIISVAISIVKLIDSYFINVYGI